MLRTEVEITIDKETNDYLMEIFDETGEKIGEYKREGEHTYINGDPKLVNYILEKICKEIEPLEDKIQRRK